MAELMPHQEFKAGDDRFDQLTILIPEGIPAGKQEPQIRSFRKPVGASSLPPDTRYRDYAEQQDELICRYRPDTILTYANRAYCSFFGKQQAELIGTSFLDQLQEEQREITRCHITALIKQPCLKMNEYPVIAAGGEIRWIQSTEQAIIDSGGKVIEFQAVSRDITEGKVSEKTLDQNKTNYRMMIEESPVMICRFKPGGTLTYINETFCEYFGRARAEMIGTSLLDLVVPEETAHSQATLDRLNSSPSHQVWESRMVLAAEKIVRIRWTIRPILDRDGKAQEYQAVGIEFSSENLVENVLEESEKHFQELVKNLHLLAVTIQMDGKITFVNDYFLEQTGYQKEEVIGRNWFEKMSTPEDGPKLQTAFQQRSTHSAALPLFQDKLVMRSGEQHLIAWNTTLLRDSHGHPLGVAGLGEDVSARIWDQKLQELVNRISQGASSARTEDELYQLIHLTLAEVMPVDNFFISLYDPERNEVRFPYYIDQYDSPPAPMRAGHSLTDYVLRTGKPLLVSPDVFDQLVAAGEVESLGAPSVDWLGVPLKVGSRNIGVMVVQSYTEGIRFSQRELQLLDFVSTQIAMTIERKRSEQALRENEEKYRVLVEASSSAIFLETMQGQILDVNTAACEMMGYTKEELLTLNVNDLVSEAIALKMPQIRQMEMVHGSSHRESVNRRKDGSYFPVEVSTRLIEIDGQPLSVVFVNDITSRKQHEREMEAIAGVSAALRTASTQADILPVLLRQLEDRLMVRGALIGLRDQTSGSFRIELACGAWAPVSRAALPRHAPLFRQVMENRSIYHNNQAAQDPLFPFPNLLDGVQAIASIPLIAQDQTVGVLTVGYERPIQTEEIHILMAISDIAASAIQRARLFEKTSQQASELAEAYDETIEGWALALELRDKETQGHSRRVTEMTLKLATAMGLTEKQQIDIRRGVLLHDIGKMAIPDSILLKPAALSEEEWIIMRKHPEFAYQMLSSIQYLHPSLDIPYCHHEKWDGGGYPRGLRGEQIPLNARIFSVVDVMDALTSDRPYRPAWSTKEALNYIRCQAGIQFDPTIVDAFIKMTA